MRSNRNRGPDSYAAGFRSFVLVLAGDADEPATRPEVLADALPNATLRVLGGDHLAVVGTPELALLAF